MKYIFTLALTVVFCSRSTAQTTEEIAIVKKYAHKFEKFVQQNPNLGLRFLASINLKKQAEINEIRIGKPIGVIFFDSNVASSYNSFTKQIKDKKIQHYIVPFERGDSTVFEGLWQINSAQPIFLSKAIRYECGTILRTDTVTYATLSDGRIFPVGIEAPKIYAISFDKGFSVEIIKIDNQWFGRTKKTYFENLKTVYQKEITPRNIIFRDLQRTTNKKYAAKHIGRSL